METALLECTKQVDIFLNSDDEIRQYLIAIAALAEQAKLRRNLVRPSKAQIAKLNLELPLLHDSVWRATRDEVNNKAEGQEGLPKDDMAAIPEEKFSGKMLDFHNTAKLAAGMFWSDLSMLLGERGSTRVKREILEWVFADELVFEDGTTCSTKYMSMIPFTCQFCCLVEEVDYEQLCAALAYMLENIQSIQEEEVRTSLIDAPQVDIFYSAQSNQNVSASEPMLAH